uniref:Uncharacterized protein n=1 Tax=Lepeophtheirus salmonis TaxID=72036 RepID=A0A0K2UXJ0_LEPSM
MKTWDREESFFILENIVHGSKTYPPFVVFVFINYIFRFTFLETWFTTLFLSAKFRRRLF